ncbi:MAG: DUF4302 domain-containing protein [Bacteroidota bacterium]
MKNWIFFGIVTSLMLGCGVDDSAELPPVEVREQEAIDNLRSLLVAPENGWSIDYRPNVNSGSFAILLNFNADGTVRVQSDINAINGQLRDQTITYRIDVAQNVELILETYTAFHYLFELDRATFGGEFEFLFLEAQESNLLFESKSDIGVDVTLLTFVPATADQSNGLSAEAFTQLGSGRLNEPLATDVDDFSPYNLYIEANDHTLSTTINLDQRVIRFHGIAQGQTMTQIETNGVRASIGRETRFGIANNTIVLDQTISAGLGGINYTISEIPLQNFGETTEVFCAGQNEMLTGFNSDGVTGLGDITLTSSLFQTHSTFRPGSGEVHAINPFFLFDENDSTLLQDIEGVFPDAAFFVWYNEFQFSQDSVLNSIGFVTVDELNNLLFYLREFTAVKNGNHFILTFNGENDITDRNVTPEQIAGLEQLTNEIFSGGEVYLFEISSTDEIYEFYNPCNKYKGYVIRQ